MENFKITYAAGKNSHVIELEAESKDELILTDKLERWESDQRR